MFQTHAAYKGALNWFLGKMQRAGGTSLKDFPLEGLPLELTHGSPVLAQVPAATHLHGKSAQRKEKSSKVQRGKWEPSLRVDPYTAFGGSALAGDSPVQGGRDG